MLRRPHYIALGLVGLLTLIVLNLPPHAAGQIKLALGGFFLWLFGLSRTSSQLVNDAGDALVPRSELLHQNEAFRRDNQELQLQRLAGADAILQENEQLRQQIGWSRQTAWNLRLASVVQRDPANWWQTVFIDLGSRDGMRVDLPVMTSGGFGGPYRLRGFS